MVLNLFSVWITYLNLVAQHDFLMKFCNHNCGGSSTGSNLKACKLVIVSPIFAVCMKLFIYFGFVYPLTNYFCQAIPFANFICKVESLWISVMLRFWNDMEEPGKNQGSNQFLCGGVSHPGTSKRIISTGDLGLVLVGCMKVI